MVDCPSATGLLLELVGFVVEVGQLGLVHGDQVSSYFGIVLVGGCHLFVRILHDQLLTINFGYLTLARVKRRCLLQLNLTASELNIIIRSNGTISIRA